MDVTYSTNVASKAQVEKLTDYRTHVRGVVEARGFSHPESALATGADELMHDVVNHVAKLLGKVTDVVVVGIGGSSLGIESIHEALRSPHTPHLHVLDAVSDHNLHTVVRALRTVPKDRLAVCIISKSGGTTETLTNAEVLLTELTQLYGEEPYDRVVCIGDRENPLLELGATLGTHVVSMQKAIGGRFSVFSPVGLVPLRLLGYNSEALLEGLAQTMREECDTLAAEGASSLYNQLQHGVRTVNFFVFDTRLEKLGRWYRQLTAESLGKAEDVDGNPVEIGFIPTISTPVELHSTGQLYFSGFKGVLTDFLSVADQEMLYDVRQNAVIASKVAGKSMQEIAYAIEGGVVAAYKERNLPFRRTTLSRLSERELGLFMGVRMLETMYLAKLMNVDAFSQPNVELYKDKTRDILDQKK